MAAFLQQDLLGVVASPYPAFEAAAYLHDLMSKDQRLNGHHDSGYCRSVC